MSSRNISRSGTTSAGLGLGLGLAILVAACGPASSPAPTGGAIGSGAPPTQPASTSPAPPTAPIGLPSFALPSFTADAELEGLLPGELGGEPVQKFSMRGDAFVGIGGGLGSDELDDILGQLGKGPEDLSVAFAGTASGAIGLMAWRIEGVDAGAFFSAFLGASQAGEGATITDATYAGKAVKQVVSADETVYVYSAGGVLFIVGGDALTAALLTEAFTKLP